MQRMERGKSKSDLVTELFFSALSDCCIILCHHAIKVMLFIFQRGSLQEIGSII